MKTCKPLQLSVLTRCFEHNHRKLMGVSVLAFVSLEDEPTLLLERDLWSFLAEELGPDAALEAGLPKAVSEFLVFGSVHTPENQPLQATATQVVLGPLKKSLLVFGDRYWDGDLFSAPQPFTRMPLSWSAAYGGPGFAANPLGKGHGQDSDGAVAPAAHAAARALPNFEYPGAEVVRPQDVGTPAGMGIVDLTWPQRAGMAGTYDDNWLKTLYPGMASDIDWRYFNLAPSDQWLDRPIAADEAYELAHLHPTRSRIQGRLPGIVARAFVNRKLGDQLRFDEVSLALRTVAFFPDRERLVLIYQGAVKIADEQAADIAHLLVGADSLRQTRNQDHYRDVLVRRLDKEEGVFHMLDDSDLTPPGMRLALLLKDLPQEEHPMTTRARKHAEEQVRATHEVLASLGLDPARYGQPLPELTAPVPPLKAIKQYMADKRAEMDAMVARYKAEGEQHKAQAIARMQEAGLDASALSDDAGQRGGPPKLNLQEQVQALSDLVGGATGGTSAPAGAQALADNPALQAHVNEAPDQMLDMYRQSAHLQPAAAPLAAPASASLRTALLQDHAQGISLAGRDLTGADLAGIDLAGADLSGVLMEGADLSGAQLSGARLPGAVLARAKLAGAQLERCDLRAANLGAADLRGASLRESDLAEAVWTQADLTRASLAGAKLGEGANLAQVCLDHTDLTGIVAPHATFMDAELRAVNFKGAVLSKAVFLQCRFVEADFSAADLTSATFIQARAAGTRFVGATLTRACFLCPVDAAPTDLAGADFSQAYMPAANLRHADLRHARFEAAAMQGADLSNAQLQSAFLYQAQAQAARFVAADLTKAVLANAGLMDAVLERAVLRGTDLRQANLFQADLARVKVDNHTRWDGSLTTRARIHPRLSHEEMSI